MTDLGPVIETAVLDEDLDSSETYVDLLRHKPVGRYSIGHEIVWHVGHSAVVRGQYGSLCVPHAKGERVCRHRFPAGVDRAWTRTAEWREEDGE